MSNTSTATDTFHGKGLLLTALLGAMFLGNIDVAVTNTATPAIQDDLGATGGQLELVVSGFTLAYGATLITTARLGLTRGYRRMFLLGVVAFTLASVVCGLAPDAWTLVVARVAQGGAAALMISQVLTGIQLHFSGDARTRALGWYAAVLAGSAVLGQLVGGLIVSADILGTSWRPVFLVNLPLGIVLLVLAARALPADDQLQDIESDPGGVLALSAGLLLLVIPLVLGREEGWPVWTWVSLVLSLVVLAGFVVHERRLLAAGRRPLMDVTLFGRPVVTFGLAAVSLSTASYFAILFVLALYLQQGLGRSAAFSGAALIPWVAAFGATGPLLGRLGPHGRRFAAAAGCAILAIAYAAIAVTLFAGDRSTVLLIVLLGVGGLGLGAAFSGSLSQVTGAVTAEHAADVSGLFNTMTRVGGMIGVAVFGSVYFATTGSGRGSDALHGFAVTNAALAVTTLVAAVLSLAAARALRSA